GGRIAAVLPRTRPRTLLRPLRPPAGHRRTGGDDRPSPTSMIPPVRRRTADHHARGHTDMELSPTGHLDTFARDNLPPDDQWPALEFTIDDVVYPDRLNAATALIDEPTARLGPDRLALTTPEGQRWTYGQLLERANQVARVLVDDHGLVPGHRVLLRAPHNPWPVAACVDKLIELTKPTVAITDHRFIDDIVTPARAHRVSLIAYGGEGDEDLTRTTATKQTTFDDVATAADDVALLCPTSGTTGAPKVTM